MARRRANSHVVAVGPDARVGDQFDIVLPDKRSVRLFQHQLGGFYEGFSVKDRFYRIHYRGDGGKWNTVDVHDAQQFVALMNHIATFNLQRDALIYIYDSKRDHVHVKILYDLAWALIVLLWSFVSYYLLHWTFGDVELFIYERTPMHFHVGDITWIAGKIIAATMGVGSLLYRLSDTYYGYMWIAE